MKDIIVGHTGFVGMNIVEDYQFSMQCCSTNIKEAYGTNPDFLVYSGVPSEMFLANNYPEKDRDLIYNAMVNIEKINPKKVVLISSIAVYDNPIDADEETDINENKLSVYGINRYILEKYIKENFREHLIIRLPALFGKGLKKNFIYDIIHRIPKMLTESKYYELLRRDSFINNFYKLQNNGFYKCRDLTRKEKMQLREYFERMKFSALNFTDSRSTYQFYNLSYLWSHIQKAIHLKIPVLNMSTEPINVAELYENIYGDIFENYLDRNPYIYDYKSIYAEEFGGENGYIFKKEQVIKELKMFIEQNINNI